VESVIPEFLRNHGEKQENNVQYFKSVQIGLDLEIMTLELNILGTSSQLPTKDRNHGAYFLRWEGETILLDPGEGAQRQCIIAGLSVPSIRTILISHFHGDHCLGLPGIIQRIALAGVKDPIRLVYPEAGQIFLDRLLTCAEYYNPLDIRYYPVNQNGVVCKIGKLILEAQALKHRVPTFGYRLVKPGGRRYDAGKLASAGIFGIAVRLLEKKGEIQTTDGRITPDMVTYTVPDTIFSYISDTALNEQVFRLMDQAALVLCEATFLESERDLAHTYDHLTAAQAGDYAIKSGVKNLILTHFSERYNDTFVIEKEVKKVFPEAYAAGDFTRYTFSPGKGSLNIEKIGKQ
jgi:ribonuclease Z